MTSQRNNESDTVSGSPGATSRVCAERVGRLDVQCCVDCRGEMWVLVLLFAKVTAAAMYKCCEPHQGLTLEDIPSCENVTSPLVAYGDVMTHRFPKDCNISVSTLPEYSYCVDKFGDDVIGLGCENETYYEPQTIFTLRRCCSNGWYDPQKHICQNSTDESHFSVDSLLGNRTCFVNTVFGLAECSPEQVVINVMVNIEDIYLFDNGSLILDPIWDTNILETYCFGSVKDGVVLVKACLNAEDECSQRTCVQKCCPEGSSMIMSRQCQPSNFDFNPQFFELDVPIENLSIDFGILSNFTCENEKFVFLPELSDDDLNYLQENGTLYIPAYENFRILSTEDYCLEKVFFPEMNMNGIYAFLCFPDPEVEELSLQFVLCSLGLITSCVFLLITFLVYASLPNLQNLHGKTLMCHVASLFSAYVCLTMAQLGTHSFKDIACAAVGYCILFTFLAAFSWLNVMCFDIWWTFGVVRSLREGSVTRKQREKRRFLMYSVYAWGVPSALTILTVLIDIIDDLAPVEIKPDMGSDHCWFSSETYGIVVFFFVPVFPMIMCNVILFVLTARSCSKVKAEIHRMQQNSLGDRCKRRYQADKTKMVMNGKLFIVMGVTWVLEMVSSMVTDPYWLWYLSDAANALQGALIFCIFVMKRKVLHTLAHKFGVRLYRKSNNSQNLSSLDTYHIRKISSNSTLNTTLTDTRSTRFSTRSTGLSTNSIR
ncbi:hypothetical protein C0J52_09245 [Blattella germanica]|nr:hypothetical protein C0J52_09245 [Blattella germanica]